MPLHHHQALTKKAQWPYCCPQRSTCTYTSANATHALTPQHNNLMFTHHPMPTLPQVLVVSTQLLRRHQSSPAPTPVCPVSLQPLRGCCCSHKTSVSRSTSLAKEKPHYHPQPAKTVHRNYRIHDSQFHIRTALLDLGTRRDVPGRLETKRQMSRDISRLL